MHKRNLILRVLKGLFLVSSLLLPAKGYCQPAYPDTTYLSIIQKAITPYVIYPKEAEIKGWKGVVKVKFFLAGDGRIKRIAIAESSGYPLLDNAAKSAVKEAGPYPLPKNYRGNKLEIIVTINYPGTKTLRDTSYKKTLSLPKKSKPLVAKKMSKIPIERGALKSEAKETTPVPAKSQPIPPQIPIAIEGAAQNPPAQRQEEKQANEPIAQAPQSQNELSGFINLAIKNSEPLKVSLEEIESIQLKMTEAKRNLFPALKLLGYNTQGEVSKVKFEENEARVQLEQPLYYGGRLVDTVKQTRANLELTEKNYDRLKYDVVHKTETAYYKLAVARTHLAQKEALREEAKELLDKVEKLAFAGLVIPLELSSAQAWFEQIGLQMESIKQDLSLAELALKQALNIKENPKIEPEPFEAKKINLDLDTCLDTAYKNRAEIFMGKSLIKYYEYGQRIESDKSSAFAVDFTSFYGRYKGHFTSDPWRSANNWYAGIKVSKPWVGSTINTSYNKESVLPRLGQVSPNKSSTASVEFNLLDNLKSLSDKKKADVELRRALSDLDETLKKVAAEVEEAFLNYQKAALQFKAAGTEMKFRRNETQVTKIRAMTGEAPLSNAVASLFELSEAQTKHNQALTNYQTSLADLKKACGYGLKI